MRKIVLSLMLLCVCLLSLPLANASAYDFSLPFVYNGKTYTDAVRGYSGEWATVFNPEDVKAVFLSITVHTTLMVIP